MCFERHPVSGRVCTKDPDHDGKHWAAMSMEEWD